MQLTTKSIQPDSLSLTPDWNLHPWALRDIPDSLKSSFDNIGIIHPPVILESENRNLTILAGQRRVQYILSKQDNAEIDCLMVGAHTEPESILNIILTDQLSNGELSLAEKARFTQIAGRYYPEDEILSRYYKRLNVKKSRSLLHSLKQLLTEHSKILLAAHTGLLGEKMLTELFNLKATDDRLALINLFMDLQLGDGKQRRFFMLLRDIAYKNGGSISTYLIQDDIQQILNNEKTNIPQKINHLGNYLQQQSRPQLSKVEREFGDKVKSLKLPPQYSLSPSPNFEKDEVTLSIIFDNFQYCDDFMRALHQNKAK